MMGFDPRGRPSPRAAMILRWIWLFPALIVEAHFYHTKVVDMSNPYRGDEGTLRGLN
jgi:hypothetical protein